jgi:hypothetical protein
MSMMISTSAKSVTRDRHVPVTQPWFNEIVETASQLILVVFGLYVFCKFLGRFAFLYLIDLITVYYFNLNSFVLLSWEFRNFPITRLS